VWLYMLICGWKSSASSVRVPAHDKSLQPFSAESIVQRLVTSARSVLTVGRQLMKPCSMHGAAQADRD